MVQSTVCFIKSHNGHKCSAIGEVVGDFRKKMTGDVDDIAAGIKKCRKILGCAEKERNDFIEQVSKTGIEIGEVKRLSS